MKKHTHNEVEKKLNNIKCTMEFEGMKLPQETIDLYRQVLIGECTIDAARKMILNQYIG